MPDPILDDVQALLAKEFGDKRILEQILRAAENEEVISNFERNYVRKLAEKHLGKKPLVEKKPSEEPQQIKPEIAEPQPSLVKPQTVQTWAEPAKITKSNSKNTKIMLGVGLASLAIIIIAAASLSGVSDISSNIEPTPTPDISKSFAVQTDLSSYTKGDIISISGNSNPSLGNQVNLVINNPDDELVWSEQINVKSDGQFATLTFAGGFGWEESGKFSIIAEGDSETVTNTFSFSR
jgi:hypothetical protein